MSQAFLTNAVASFIHNIILTTSRMLTFCARAQRRGEVGRSKMAIGDQGENNYFRSFMEYTWKGCQD